MPSNKHPKSPIAEDLSTMQVAHSLPCARCGYDIRGLPADGDCPECGEPIRLTIIEVVDPATRRLEPIANPRLIGNSITGVVSFFFISVLLAVVALLTRAPDSLPVPEFFSNLPAKSLLWTSLVAGLAAMFSLLPIMNSCSAIGQHACRQGIKLTSTGLLAWSVSMALVALVLFGQHRSDGISMLFDTIIPVVSGGIVFSGFRKLIPRLGQRSRAFRQAQGSRQRMNDLLATLIVVLIGRTLMVVSLQDSNLYMLGLIVMVMSLSLIAVGLAYVVRNTIWIRQALITPPPALTQLLTPTT